ncbi:hypothetical protein B0H13DRAFT_2262465 [Mycena leptocephala]|nr:hypothetical protein B0H13DRAFT_2262465 [Mycena leptocephala]
MARQSPSRRRHMADALGSSEIDRMIFQVVTQGPVIPATTVFVFAADENMFNLMLDNSSNPPRGLKAFRDQNLIETPQYEKLERPRTEVVEVRNSHDRWRRGSTVTRQNLEADADAVYERRHRPLELKEKRESQHHREQLKRLPHQLRKRVEELENMPNSVFLEAPATWFSPVPVHQIPFVTGDEGSRRKTEMLLNASVLMKKCLRYTISIRQAHPYHLSSACVSREHSLVPYAPQTSGGSYKRKREFMDYVCVPRKKCDQKSSRVEARGCENTGNQAANSNEEVRAQRARENPEARTFPPDNCPEEPRAPNKRATDSPDFGGHKPIFRVASIDADNSVLFQNSSRTGTTDEIKLPVCIKWSLDDQATFDSIAQHFRDILPGPGFTLPVGSDVLLVFKRIAAQMPRATTSQVLEFYYWRQNPDTFNDTEFSVPTTDPLYRRTDSHFHDTRRRVKEMG